jgi:hypothetical protein
VTTALRSDLLAARRKFRSSRHSLSHRMEFVKVYVRRLGFVLATTAFAAVAVSLTGMATASAHTTDISGTATCAPDGTYSVTWSGVTGQTPKGDVAKVRVTRHDPAASSVPATVTTNLAPNAPYSFTQQGIPGDATQATVHVHIYWSGTDKFTAGTDGKVTLSGDCAAPVAPAAPAAPTQSTPTCQQPDLTVTTPKTAGVTYKVNGPLTLAPGQSVVITPVANEGVVLSKDAHPWTVKNDFQVSRCAKPTVTPAAPTTSKASCAHPDEIVTLPKTKHVTFKVSGSLVLKPGKSVTITPIADSGFQLAKGSKAVTIKNAFKASSECAAATATTPPPPPAAQGLASTGTSLVPLAIGGLVLAVGGLVLVGARRIARV